MVISYMGIHYKRGIGDSEGLPPSSTIKLAEVDEIELLLLESFPVQVKVIVRGDFPDTCTEIDKITTLRKDDSFLVTLTVIQSAGKMCTPVVTPFEEVIILDVVGLEAGSYTVDVNGVTDMFELQVDNIIRIDGGLSVSEVLEAYQYDVEVKVYGKVSLLGDLFCPCFELTSGGTEVMVWYDLMVEDDGTERPSVNVDAIKNGDWVIVVGELKSAGQHRSQNDFWASTIEKIA
jgi:hypothetical protein